MVAVSITWRTTLDEVFVASAIVTTTTPEAMLAARMPVVCFSKRAATSV